ncbi:MAG TPA: primosomal replication protein PriC, partial [Aliidiomarina sp.]|nr:primosomal replication protein PriC [Aliidiomarina sp.]
MVHPKDPAALFTQLYEKAAETTAELTRPWFDKTLFSCRSTVIRDYVSEAEDTWQRCQQLTSYSASSQIENQAQQQWLIER